MDNPTAFPVLDPKNALGMDLRDYFAAAALAYLGPRGTPPYAASVVAYQIADAMLEARKA